MLLPTDSLPVDFPQNFYQTPKARLFTSKCLSRSSSPAGEKIHNTFRGRLRFCVCTGPRKNPKKTTKWYVKQPTWRLWGEEKADDAVYTVYLKKVRYHRPTRSIPSSHSDSDDEISHLEWETVRVRFVKAGTLKKLVEALSTDDGELETTYINIFLATYRSFSTPREVLKLLLARYEELSENSVNGQSDHYDEHKKTLISALHVWLDSYPEDFKDPPDHPALEQLLNFCEEYLPSTELEAKVRHRLHRYSRETNVDPVMVSPPAFALRTAAAGSLIYKLPDVPVRHFAEQLTRMDVDNFKKLVPYQCLGGVWSRRDKIGSQQAATVYATIDQFNAVIFRVTSSILFETGLRVNERAQIIACWIDIAQELRLIKNFSSLNAIIMGLGTTPVYRLEKTWAAVPREKYELFQELAEIFSDDNNKSTQRELLMREGTARYADTVGENDRQLQKIFQKQNHHIANISFGTIPFLGTFLTDLTMIDTAMPDTIANGLINFDKRRKEFEVLAQIKLLQGAANAYQFKADPAFDRWFDSILALDDNTAYQLSCQIEPPNIKTKPKKKTVGHQKHDSVTSTSSNNSSQYNFNMSSMPSSPHNSIERKLSPSQISNSSSSSSLPSLDMSLNSSHSGSANNKLNVPYNSGTLSPNHSQKGSPDFYIIKVTYETDCVETDGIVLYKSITLNNNERTPQVIRNAMYKLGLEGNPDQYTIAQVLPDKEMVLPPNANVYYAVNASHNLNFILRPKKTTDDTNSVGKNSKGKLKLY